MSLSVCKMDYVKSYEQIMIKFHRGPKKKWLEVCGNLDSFANSGSHFKILSYYY